MGMVLASRDTVFTVFGVLFLIGGAVVALIIGIGLLWTGIKPWLPKEKKEP